MSGASGAARKWTSEELDRFLALPEAGPEGAAVPAADGSAPDLAPYFDAAAVLAAFDPFRLLPAYGARGEGDIELLLDHLIPLCEPIEGGSQHGLWSLSFAERRAALHRLGTRAAMQQALDANPGRPDTPVQRMFERVVAGDPIDPATLGRDDLAALLTVLEWVEGILDHLPGREAISPALALADLLAPMQRLAGEGFVNRQQELARLGQYVLAPDPVAPLFVFGPGGVGKSTLLARFILDHVQNRAAAFAYLDTDRPTLRPDRPLTYLIEMIAQLRLQLDLPADATDSLIKELTFGAGRQDEVRQVESVSSGYGYEWYLRFLGDILARSGNAKARQNIVVVIDTFEEAQFLGSEVVWQLLDLAFAMREVLSNFRVILSGRPLPEQFVQRAFPGFDLRAPEEAWGEDDLWLEAIPLPERPLNLGVLDEPAARDLLRNAVEAAGLPPLTEDELSDVIGLVGRNPMVLKLAVRVLRNEGVEKLRESRNELLAQLTAEKIQAFLYGRILHHIHGDEAVKKVAYPGLIVRRITPEVIREVLAEPCQLLLTPQRNEDDIFRDLSREAALLDWDATDGSLRHRADVRRLMLEDLTDYVDEEVVRQIDHAAVDFYAGQTGEAARGEEIYHRLRLEEPEEVLEDRWLSAVAVRLRAALQELPSAQMRVWLANKLGASLDPAVREAAGVEAWEAQAARVVGRLLAGGKAEEALAVLRERPERSPRSRLYFLEAEALHLAGRLDQALEVCHHGVAALIRAGAVDMALELKLKMATIEEGRGALESADARLAEAAAIAAHSRNDLLRLRVQVTQLRVQRQLRPDARDERAELRRAALAGVTDEVLYRLRSQPVLLREVAAELGKDDPRIAQAAIGTLGLEVTTDAQAQSLGRALAALNAEQDPATATNAALARAVEEFEASDYDPNVVRDWVIKRLSQRETRNLGESLGSSAPESQTLGDFRTYFRAGVENSLRGASKGRE
jgi:hypothetical protein